MFGGDSEFEHKRYLAFGHNFSGDTSVFDTKENFRVLEFWHDSRTFDDPKQSFKEYIRESMLMDADGNDLRSK